MSAKSKGTSPAEEHASKTRVKQQIKVLVQDLELVLGDLKDVAKELKEDLFSSVYLWNASMWRTDGTNSINILKIIQDDKKAGKDIRRKERWSKE